MFSLFYLEIRWMVEGLKNNLILVAYGLLFIQDWCFP